jgi:DNA-binding PadR family transcriptional regulator
MKEAKTKSKNELLPGTLEMLILKTLSIESMHGYGIAQHIQMLSLASSGSTWQGPWVDSLSAAVLVSKLRGRLRRLRKEVSTWPRSRPSPTPCVLTVR